MALYGHRVVGSEWRPNRSVVGRIEATHSGNLVLAVGREVEVNGQKGWLQTEHLVIAPDEAREFIAEIQSVLGLDPA